MFYAFSENFVLPISHDEVVHGKKSLLDKMPGTLPEKFANQRAFSAYMFAHPGKKLNFMGNEYGQLKEWAYKEGLEFFMTNFDTHKKLQKFNRELNNLYKSTPCLYEIEDSWDGFKWISADERDNNIVSFERKDKNGNVMAVLINFSGNTFTQYRLGLEKGTYKLIFNTDDAKFGGSGLIKSKTYKTAKKSAQGRQNSILLKVPPFSGLYLIKVQ